MKLREKLADWISGGALTKQKAWGDEASVRWQKAIRDYSSALEEKHKLQDALAQIKALDTPKAAHGVKKAVKIAHEALTSAK